MLLKNSLEQLNEDFLKNLLLISRLDLNGVNGTPNNHQFAEITYNALRGMGYDVELQHGSVQYSAGFLIENLILRQGPIKRPEDDIRREAQTIDSLISERPNRQLQGISNIVSEFSGSPLEEVLRKVRDIYSACDAKGLYPQIFHSWCELGHNIKVDSHPSGMEILSSHFSPFSKIIYGNKRAIYTPEKFKILDQNGSRILRIDDHDYEAPLLQSTSSN